MRRLPRFGFTLLVCLAPALAEAPLKAQAEPLRAAGDRPVDIHHIRLDLKVDLRKKAIDARATLRFTTMRPLAAVPLDAVGFEVTRVALQNGDDKPAPARFSHDGNQLVIDLNPAWPAGREGRLEIDYKIREPKDGLFFFGPTAAEPDVPLTVWSQGETHGNRHWIPCLDHSNQRQTTELVVTVADGFEVLSNGKLLDRKTNGDGTVTFHWLQDKPHVAYLITLVVGKFDVVREDWDGMPVQYYVPPGHKDDVARTFGRTREMLTFFSKRFGIHYPWDKYAQVVVEQYTFGGMENTSATTLTPWAVHDARARLDSSPESLIAHELAHQWWGDLLTCRDWSHLWLNEGFASYAEALWEEQSKGRDDYAYEMLLKGRNARGGGGQRPIVDRHYREPWDMFDARSYPKGAYVLHMLRHRLGEDTFWKGIQEYGTRHRLQTVETADFRRTMERISGRSLERFFYDWTERPGHPVLEVKTEYLPETKLARVHVKQTQAGEPFHFPLSVVFRYPPSAQEVRVEEEVAEKEQSFYVTVPDRPVLVEVDPEQAVLAEIKEDQGREQWQTQLTNSPHVACRVRAAEHFGHSKEPADREALIRALPTEKFWHVQVEIANALGESGGDECRDALIAGLKNAHPSVRKACAEQLGKFHRDAAVAKSLKELLAKGDPSYFVESAGLAAYSHLQQPDTVALLTPWLTRPSHQETIRTAALEGLGRAQEVGALDTLILWTKRGKPRECRTAALRGLAQLAKTANPSDEQRKQIVAAVSACLDGEGVPVRREAITTLRDLGRSAMPTLAALDALRLHDPNNQVRDLAKAAVEQIRSNAPAPVELTRLREELDRLKQSNETLRDRVKQVEKLEQKGHK